MDVLAGSPPLTWITPRDDGTLVATDDLEVLRQALCADVDKELAEAELRRMVLQSTASVTAASSAPERRHPTTYIICGNDRVIPPAAQEQMAARADHVERLASSHQPMVSMPRGLAAVLDRVR